MGIGKIIHIKIQELWYMNNDKKNIGESETKTPCGQSF